MTKRIFKDTMIIIVLVVFLCGIFIFSALYKYFDREFVHQLTDEAQYIAMGVEAEGLEYLGRLETKNKNPDTRITWILQDGTVCYDNKADISTMDNHLNREEIQKALTSSEGNSDRYSKSLSENTLYHAIRLSDGTVLRVSRTKASIFTMMMGMLQPILIIVVLAIVIAAILAYRLSKQIVGPLEAIDLDNPDENAVYDEMAPFIRKISNQNTEIKESMEKLRKQQHEFSLITENMSEGLVMVDRKSHILSCNKSAIELFDISSEIIGKNIVTINRDIHFVECVNKALEGRHEEDISTMNNRRCQLYFNPVFNNGEVAGAIILITDVTEKEEREELRREFSANVSHELKTPITSISGIAEIIKNGIVDDKDIRKFAGKIYDEARRLLTLVEDIIKLSRLDEQENGKFSNMEKCEVDLYKLAEKEIDRLKLAAEEKNISVTLEGESVELLAIPSIIQEMVYNLVDNAIKYNVENGKVTVKVKKDEKNHIRLSVKDTGIGIPKESQARVFERFYRVDKSHSREIGGTGLGLSIVKHGAMLHNASIVLDSKEGKGTKIDIVFQA